MVIKDPPVEITENLWMFGTNQYPLYLFKGHTIFEGGIGAMGRLMREQMERLDIPRDSVKQVVIPHGHPDHSMAVPSLREIFPGITVLASEAAAATLSAEKAISFFCDVDAQLTRSLMKAGLIAESHCPKPLAEKQIPVDVLLKEGDTLSIDGSRFRVLHTPGHSDCSLSFHEPDEGLLFISDASGYYMPEFDCWWVNYFTGYETYIRSMQRLAALEAETLCLGHLGVIRGAEDVKTYFDRAIDATEQYHRRIIEEARPGNTIRKIAEQLGSEVYEKTQLMPLEFLQKNCGLLVKQSLKHEGMTLDK
ncbi:MAG TPA: MBL fold metallo-hydrolase [Thermoguttaceae bacterium]|nr:MBL fold metallo-hydrolase [Thermoguttaceae bacterium]